MDNIDKRLDSIEKRLVGIEKRLDNTATKDDLEAKITAAKEETMRHTGVLIEGVQHQIELLAEGITNVNEKLDRGWDEHKGEHARLEKRTLINTADIAKLDQRVTRLEGNPSALP